MNSPRVQVFLKNGSLPDALTAALDRTSATVTIHRFEDVCPAGGDSPADAVVVVAPSDPCDAKMEVERLFHDLGTWPCGTLVVTDGPLNGLGTAVRPPALPISFAIDPSEDELVAKLATICELGQSLRHIAKRTKDLERRGNRIADEAHDLDEQLRLASQVQRDFLPHRIPQCDDVRFVTLFRPAEHVSGDIYDIARLDETHIGISVADVAGHGIPAALLTLFVKRAWRAKEINGNTYRIIPPDELLSRLNGEILEADLQDCHFIAASCAVYDLGRRVITWARGGLPYPILVRPAQRPRIVQSRGRVLGAFEDVTFELQREQLRPGDTMLFFSDGLEALLIGDKASTCESLEQTEWFASLGRGPIDEPIDEISRIIDRTPPDQWPRDDVTLVAICVNP